MPKNPTGKRSRKTREEIEAEPDELTFEEEEEIYWSDQFEDDFPELDGLDDLEDLTDSEDEWYEEQ